jgi:hypothetical protein
MCLAALASIIGISFGIHHWKQPGEKHGEYGFNVPQEQS